MNTSGAGQPLGWQERLLTTLEQLLAINSPSVKAALDAGSDLLTQALNAEKVDAFLFEPATNTLVAVGTSKTPLADKQRSLGLDRQPLANGGRAVSVYISGAPYLGRHVEDDSEELLGVRTLLGVRSEVLARFSVAGEPRGVLGISSTQPEAFTEADLHFAEAAANWVGMLTHRGELIEEITRETARQARQEAAEELIAILAHDLGNYITPLRGNLDIIRRRAVRSGNSNELDETAAMSSAIDRLSGIIQELLDASRLDQGLFEINPQPLDLVALVQDTAEPLNTPGLPVELRLPEELTLQADPARLRQALENLLANALKHSPTGMAVVVEVSSVAEERGRVAKVTITDQGPGIAPDMLPRLFTRFGRGPGSKGLGLGLYLARSIAEAHGGTLTVESAPGQGASFILVLPM